MGMIASQITSLTIVYSTIDSDADQRKNQSSASLAFVWGIHWWLVNSPHKWPVRQKIFPFDDVIMVYCKIKLKKRYFGNRLFQTHFDWLDSIIQNSSQLLKKFYKKVLTKKILPQQYENIDCIGRTAGKYMKNSASDNHFVTETKSYHGNNLMITGSTAGCHYDNLQCSQW